MSTLLNKHIAKLILECKYRITILLFANFMIIMHYLNVNSD